MTNVKCFLSQDKSNMFCLGSDLDTLLSFLKTWRKRASGQIASSIGFFRSKKCLIGGFSSLEIFCWFPLSIALSGCFLFNEQYRGVMHKFSEIGVASLVHLVNALLIQHPVEVLGTPSGG
ncbi:hypothetical protein OIU76_004234 [Salix suchowensis]|nr:hypothetical protein OIU76_004234 [Salix suchowensis]